MVGKMSKTIDTVEELLAHVQVMEREACECYLDLAEQMDMHNNPEVAALFTRLAADEKEHLAYVEKLIGKAEIPHIAPWNLKNFGDSGIDVTGTHYVHYMMTPYHALKLARRAERNTVSFFVGVIETSNNQEVRHMAAEFEQEEQRHIEQIEQWLNKVARPDEDWDDDPDPPVQPT